MPSLDADEVLVETQISAISAGTELLVYRGQFPRDVVDSHDKLSSGLNYPLTYGYACVGKVFEIGASVAREWEDRLVFSFQPHTSHFMPNPNLSSPFPNPCHWTPLAFSPIWRRQSIWSRMLRPSWVNVSLCWARGSWDYSTAALLHEFPLEWLVTADRYELRRKASLELGVSASLDPTFDDFRAMALQSSFDSRDGFDLTIELSGNPSALDDAIGLTIFSGRVMIGSWYGEKRAMVDLGGKFPPLTHQMISSQVSSISPELSGRWDKSRRFGAAWNALKRIQPQKWITHRFPLAQAAQAYQLLDNSPEQTLQTIFDYK